MPGLGPPTRCIIRGRGIRVETAMKRGLFRDEALAFAAAGGADLSADVRVVGTGARLAALLLAGLAGGALLAVATVEIPIRAAGHGVLVDPSGALIVPAAALAPGRVTQVAVRMGDRVAQGDVIARLDQPDLDASIREAERALAEQRRRADRLAALRAADAEARARAEAREVASLDERAAGLARRRDALADRLADLEGLETRGVATRQSVTAARLDLEDAEEALLDARSARAAFDARREATATEDARAAAADALAVEDAQAALDALRARREAEGVIRAPAAGRVAAVEAPPGAAVAAGDPVVSILAEATDAAAPIEALVFAPMADGKRLRSGAEALLAPAVLAEGERARLKGRVAQVGEAPVGAATLARVLGDDGLAAQAAAGGPVFAVTVALERGPSGWLWTTPDPPTPALAPGTPLTAALTLERAPLYALLMPGLERLFGARDDAWTGAPATAP
ncbi:MAG: NHLP bacteriocin system secretion protein [Rhodobacteraceae bacterium]|nr:MAG: NHLP bacteriocin system secretion protein [Paracoccaceae bacterium]